MKRTKVTMKEIIGGLMFYTYEHKILMIITTIVLAIIPILLFNQGLDCYNQHLELLERYGMTASIYQLKMWLWDIASITMVFVFLIYISEAMRNFIGISLMDKVLDFIIDDFAPYDDEDYDEE